MSVAKTTFSFNLEQAIHKGIMSGEGNFDDITLLTEEDFISLGKIAADRGIKKRKKFPSWMVTPINSVEEGIREGHYDGYYGFISNKTVPLKKVGQVKKVYLVSFKKKIFHNDYIARLAECGLKPCIDGPNYLLGLMKGVLGREMPEGLQNKYIVAAECNNPSSIFASSDGTSCFLCVRDHSSRRILGMVYIDEEEWPCHWAFLAEKL